MIGLFKDKAKGFLPRVFISNICFRILLFHHIRRCWRVKKVWDSHFALKEHRKRPSQDSRSFRRSRYFQVLRPQRTINCDQTNPKASEPDSKAPRKREVIAVLVLCGLWKKASEKRDATVFPVSYSRKKEKQKKNWGLTCISDPLWSKKRSYNVNIISLFLAVELPTNTD